MSFSDCGHVPRHGRRLRRDLPRPGRPLGILTSYLFSAYLAGLLNVEVSTYIPPLWVFGLETLVGLGVPVLAGLLPVLAGTRVTVREALGDKGIARRRRGPRSHRPRGWANHGLPGRS